VPAKPFAPVTVITHVPEPPGEEMVIVPEHPEDSLIPGDPTVTVTEEVVELPM
jgi:hypothetical protein